MIRRTSIRRVLHNYYKPRKIRIHRYKVRMFRQNRRRRIGEAELKPFAQYEVPTLSKDSVPEFMKEHGYTCLDDEGCDYKHKDAHTAFHDSGAGTLDFHVNSDEHADTMHQAIIKHGGKVVKNVSEADNRRQSQPPQRDPIDKNVDAHAEHVKRHKKYEQEGKVGMPGRLMAPGESVIDAAIDAVMEGSPISDVVAEMTGSGAVGGFVAGGLGGIRKPMRPPMVRRPMMSKPMPQRAPMQPVRPFGAAPRY